MKDNIAVLVGPKIGRHLRGAPYLLGLGLKYHQIKAGVNLPVDENEYFEKFLKLIKKGEAFSNTQSALNFQSDILRVGAPLQVRGGEVKYTDTTS